jgi:hypothetical protein
MDNKLSMLVPTYEPSQAESIGRRIPLHLKWTSGTNTRPYPKKQVK